MKKTLTKLITAVAVFLIGSSHALAAINIAGFEFVKTIKPTTRTYYVALDQLGSSSKMSDGSYDVRGDLGFYGAEADIESDEFIDDVFGAVVVKIKKQGTSSYLGELETEQSIEGTSVQNYSGLFSYKQLFSRSGAGYLDPGKYTVDALLGTAVIDSISFCLPTFTSSIGKSKGNETCGGTTPTTPTTPAPSNPNPTPNNPTPTDPNTNNPPGSSNPPSNPTPNTPAPTNPPGNTNPVPVTNNPTVTASDSCTGQDCYQTYQGLNEALEGQFSSFKDAQDLTGFINALIGFAIGIAGVLAVVMIMYEGFLYMSTDNVTTKATARSRMVSTVAGFVLLLTTYTLLRTINPDLLVLMPHLDGVTLDVGESGDTNQALEENIEKNPEIAKIYATSKGHWRDAGTLKPATESARQTMANSIPSSDLYNLKANGFTLWSKVNNSGNHYIHKSVGPKLKALDAALKAQGIKLIVTEAFKPTIYKHYASCHYTGTCIDGDIEFNAVHVATLIAEAKKAGLVAVWETRKQADYQKLLNLGVPKSNVILFTGHITGDHASIYDYQ